MFYSVSSEGSFTLGGSQVINVSPWNKVDYKSVTQYIYFTYMYIYIYIPGDSKSSSSSTTWA